MWFFGQKVTTEISLGLGLGLGLRLGLWLGLWLGLGLGLGLGLDQYTLKCQNKLYVVSSQHSKTDTILCFIRLKYSRTINNSL